MATRFPFDYQAGTALPLNVFLIESTQLSIYEIKVLLWVHTHLRDKANIEYFNDTATNIKEQYFNAIDKLIKKGILDGEDSLVEFNRDFLDSLFEEDFSGQVIEHKNQINSYVYIMGYGDKVKIGKTTNINKRFGSLSGSSPIEPELLWYSLESRDINEKILHHRFKEYRLHGEYFNYSEEIVEFISLYDNLSKAESIITES